MAVGYPVVAGLLAAIGPLAGAYIATKAKSEVRKGVVNLRMFAHILLALILFFVISQYTFTLWIPALVAFLFGGILSYHDVCCKRTLPNKATTILFVVLAFVMLFFLTTPHLPIVASLVFMYGVAVGSLSMLEHGWKMGAKYALTLAISFLLVVFFVNF